MSSVIVRDFMVPLSEYATVSQEATLFEAVQALKEAQEKFDQRSYKHRAILVYDQYQRIVGKVSQNDVLRGLEPGYKKIGDLDKISHWGLSKGFITSMMRSHDLWQHPLDNICRRAVRIRVKDIMYTPEEGEFVPEDSTLNEAIHQLVVGRHQSLLVTKNDQVVGILRLTDVFAEISKVLESCSL
jgi:CBS domain containing-hemolysin-like protein